MILQQFSLKGKTAIVTGCGTGLGLGISQEPLMSLARLIF
jgi:NAD(P)-dependent dehydrogenase (short-subunit alcohol dehydrogenase family)